MMPRMEERTPLAALAAAILTCALFAAPAGATTASLVDGVLTVTADPGPDQVGVFVSGAGSDVIAVKDDWEPVTAGPGCLEAPFWRVECPLAQTRSVEVRLGAGNDGLLTSVPVPLAATGDEGDDALRALAPSPPRAPAPVAFDGGPGDDRLTGSSVADTLLGGPGDDGIGGQAGPDLVVPGPGRDTVTDLDGDDRVDAQDGTPDRVDCGPGTDTGYFDAVDEVSGCELGTLPPPHPDCTPEVAPVSRAAARRVRRTGLLRLLAGAEAHCVLRASLLADGRVVVTVRAAEGGATPELRSVRVGARAARRLRAARAVRLVVTGVAPGGRPIARTFRLPR